MDTSQIAQSLRELTFSIYQRPLHPELFEIHRQEHFFQGDYEVMIWLTGCRHVVSVFYKGDCLTEVICDPLQMLPSRGLIERFPFRRERTHTCHWSAGLGYMMSFQVEAMSGNLYRQTHQDLVKMGKKRGLYVPFPQWSYEEYTPFSLIDYEAHYDELHLQSFHAFPQCQTILKSQSLFTLKRKSKSQVR